MMRAVLLWTLLIAALILGAVMVPLMDNDAAHHAVIALNMVETGDYTTMTDVINYSTPYFDKPHLQFWLVGGSFAMLGVGGFVYKLSSLLAVLLALFSTYKLGEYLMPRRNVGALSALVLLSMAGFMLSSSVDIRMDAILLGVVTFGIWQGVLAIDKGRWYNTVGLALGLALSLSSKGMFGVFVIGVTMFFYMIGARRLSWIVSWKFLLVILLFGVFIIPELWAFYDQFGWEGVRFILYEQVFIRTGGGMGVEAASDPFFFAHSFLWIAIPWSVMILNFALRSLFGGRFDKIYWLTLPSAVTVILFLSFSSFKLPHYINPLLPLFAIFAASQIVQLVPRTKLFRGVSIVQRIIICIMIALGGVANYWSFIFSQWWLAALVGIAFLWVLIEAFRPWRGYENMVYASVLASAVLWLSLNVNFYPQLMKYQGGNVAAEQCDSLGISNGSLYLYKPLDYSASLDIHGGQIHTELSIEDIRSRVAKGQKLNLYVERVSCNELVSDTTLRVKKLFATPDYRVTIMLPEFLNPATRANVVDSVYIVEVQKGEKI